MVGCGCDVCRSTDPHDKRLRSSILVRVDSQTIVVDCGPDFRTQMLRERVMSIDAILLTHEHKDHVSGLDDIRGFNVFLRREIPIYAEQRVLEAVQTDFRYAFGEMKYPGAPDMELHEIVNQPFRVGTTHVTPIRGFHHELPVLGFRIGDFAYLTDFNLIPEEEFPKLKGIDTLVINALQRERHTTHFTLEQALEQIERIAPRVSYLTHTSHRMGFHEDTERSLPPGVHMAYDGMKLEVG